MITLEDYLSASGKYPERLTHPELTQDVKTNAETKIATIIKEILRIFLNFETKVKF